MDCSKLTAAQRKKVESHGNEVVNIEFTLRTPLHEPCVEADYVHFILGRILTEAENGSDEEIGRVEASLVQFSEAVDSGISPDRLGDGIDGNISEYWECLFDPNDGRLKQEVLDDHEFLGCDLLIIDRIEVVPTRSKLQRPRLAHHKPAALAEAVPEAGLEDPSAVHRQGPVRGDQPAAVPDPDAEPDPERQPGVEPGSVAVAVEHRHPGWAERPDRRASGDAAERGRRQPERCRDG